MAPDRDHGVRATTTEMMITTVLEVAAAQDAGEVRLNTQIGQDRPNADMK